MIEYGPLVFDPLSAGGEHPGQKSREMSLQDVNELVELTHQPYMYERQSSKMAKRFGDLGLGLSDGDVSRSNQQAISVLRFALQCAALFSKEVGGDFPSAVSSAEGFGNIPERRCYRGETSLRFYSDETARTSAGGKCTLWLQYRVRVSGSYKIALWADLERLEAGNTYMHNGFSVSVSFADLNGEPIRDLFEHEGDCDAIFSVTNFLAEDGSSYETSHIRCMALLGLVDYLGTLHLSEVEVRLDRGKIAHQTNTLVAQAWRVAFEALNERALRKDKYGSRKFRFRVFCCPDCGSPRIVKRGKNAVRCPLCSNNNTKPHKSAARRVY